QMFVQIAHSVTANSSLSPPPTYHWIRDGEEHNATTFDLTDPAPAAILQYGYSDVQQDQFYLTTSLFAAAALILAGGFAVFSLRGERWSSFWRAQIIMPFMIWSGWLALITGQDGLSIVRLAAGREGVVGAVPAIAKLCLAPFTLQLASSLIAFPGYKR